MKKTGNTEEQMARILCEAVAVEDRMALPTHFVASQCAPLWSAPEEELRGLRRALAIQEAQRTP